MRGGRWRDEGEELAGSGGWVAGYSGAGCFGVVLGDAFDRLRGWGVVCGPYAAEQPEIALLGRSFVGHSLFLFLAILPCTLLPLCRLSFGLADFQQAQSLSQCIYTRPLSNRGLEMDYLVLMLPAERICCRPSRSRGRRGLWSS